MASVRVGFGVDVHRLADGLTLMVGGKEIPSPIGAVGHSDADVLLHAICDALLGALNLRDIGFHFSDTDPKYKGIDSQVLLTNVYELIEGRGYEIVNLDSTVILESPKLNPHIISMQEVISKILKTDQQNISIKATTHERVDSFGEGKAIKAYCVCLLEKVS